VSGLGLHVEFTFNSSEPRDGIDFWSVYRPYVYQNGADPPFATTATGRRTCVVCPAVHVCRCSSVNPLAASCTRAHLAKNTRHRLIIMHSVFCISLSAHGAVNGWTNHRQIIMESIPVCRWIDIWRDLF